MTFSDLLDQVVADAGDTGSTYRTNARRWLNLARAEIGNQCLWQYALRPEASITTASGTDIYSVADTSVAPNGIEFIWGDTIQDSTNNNVVKHESLGQTYRFDPDEDVTGPPAAWGDAGATSAGVPQIRFWPVPDGIYTMNFSAYVRQTDITAAQDTLDIDPFFGPLSPWGPTFTAGIRFFHDMNNNEDVNQVVLSESRFRRLIKERKAQNRITISGSMKMRVVNNSVIQDVGRLDPGHYENRW